MQERISIEEAIREAGLKKKYVANELGVSETYINEYLKKPGSISVKNASIICKLTNKKLNEIDFGEDVEINWYFFKFKLQKNWSLILLTRILPTTTTERRIIMEQKNYSESLDPIERESFLEKLNDCNDIEYLKKVIEVCRSKAIYLALKKEGLI